MFSLQQNRRRKEWNRFCLEAGGRVLRGEVPQTMYTHVSKCKNDKIKGEMEKKRWSIVGGL
jgi:hypothetical protein